MTLFNDIAHLFPITNPTWIFLVVLVIILFAPLIFNRIRVPHLVGMILAGVLVGENGLNVLSRDSSFELFGKMGLYYIMFLASLEMDLEGLKKNRTRGIIFGLITFAIPFALGYGVGQWVLGLRWDASLLFSCIISSHTLVAYPVVGRYGLSRHDCVTIAIAGTMIALLLALFTLAGISASAEGDISAKFWMGFALKCAVYCFFIFFCYPRFTRYFFKRYSDNVTQFTFVLVLLVLSAAMSELAGLEGLFGAFLAGLVLNRYIPRVSPLMNRIEFVGNALFIITSTGYADAHRPVSKLFLLPGGELKMNRYSALLNVYLGALYGSDNYVEGSYLNEIYLNHAVIEKKQLKRSELLERCTEFFDMVKGVKQVHTSLDLLSGNADAKARGAYNADRSGDLMLEIAPGWTLKDERWGEEVYNIRTHVPVPILYYGGGLSAKRSSAPIPVESIAPTVAHLLRITAPNACDLRPVE